jgi:hypothetical protein
MWPRKRAMGDETGVPKYWTDRAQVPLHVAVSRGAVARCRAAARGGEGEDLSRDVLLYLRRRMGADIEARSFVAMSNCSCDLMSIAGFHLKICREDRGQASE